MAVLRESEAVVSEQPPTNTKSPFGGRAGPTFNLTDFGAIGDNATLNTPAFVKAVAAVEKAGGGTLVSAIYVPFTPLVPR